MRYFDATSVTLCKLVNACACYTRYEKAIVLRQRTVKVNLYSAMSVVRCGRMALLPLGMSPHARKHAPHYVICVDRIAPYSVERAKRA